MAYVYILYSLKDKGLYTGSTLDLVKRLKDHNSSKTKSTSYRRPLKLVYYEYYEAVGAARVREKHLKGPTAGKSKWDLILNFPREKLRPYDHIVLDGRPRRSP